MRGLLKKLEIELSQKSESLDIKEDGYHINDFLKFNDQDFVVNAYYGILRRMPDATGLNYFLDKIRQGSFTKIEALGRIRYSSEGRSIGVKVRGLLLPLLVNLF